MDTLGLFYVNVKTSLEVNSRIAQYLPHIFFSCQTP